MNTQITEGVKISVETKFNSKLSVSEENSFVFEYLISIKNCNIDAVQLLTRNWYIFDTLDEPKEIEGPGVVGEQPVLDLNQEHTYRSYCELKSEIGYMEGHYTFVNLRTNKKFKVLIPRFNLILPSRLN